MLSAVQRVRQRCQGKHAPDDIKLLPFDLCGAQETLQQAAADAVQAFPGCSVQYLVQNAGQAVLPQSQMVSAQPSTHSAWQ